MQTGAGPGAFISDADFQAAGASIAEAFDKDRVAASVRAIQQGQIGYADFLGKIMAAGCARYEVFIGGRKAMYFGRDGEFHTEHFPTPRN